VDGTPGPKAEHEHREYAMYATSACFTESAYFGLDVKDELTRKKVRSIRIGIARS
jgi:hypothetical protein